ncbi:MAG: peptide chain release factor-like protein [Planctomycetota bacterium]
MTPSSDDLSPRWKRLRGFVWDHPAQLDDDALLARCKRSADRSTGPGGTRHDTVRSAVTLEDRDTGLVARASDRREAARNLSLALRRMRFELALHVRCGWVAPSDRWRARVRNKQLAINPGHADAPALVAEALDAIEARGDVKPAAEALGVSTTQLVRFLATEPRALAAVNERRQRQGKRPLRA